MTPRFRFSAPSLPPLTGASSTCAPRSVKRRATSRMRLGRLVEVSMSTASRAMPSSSSTPCGPIVTLATCSGPGREVRMTSVWRATSAGEAARAAPRPVNSATAASRTSWTVRAKPAAWMLRAMPAPMLPSPMNPTRMARLLLGEDFLEEGRGAGGGIGPDHRLLLTHHMEEAVERLARDVVVEVEALRLDEGDRLELAHQRLVLLGHTDLAHALVDHRLEGRGELVRGLGLEVVGGRGVAAREDLLGVVEAHVRDGIPEDLLGRGGSLLRRTIHTQDELVDLRAIAHRAQTLLHALELGGHENLDGRVAEVAVRPSREAHRLLGGDLQRLLETGAGLAVGDAAAAEALQKLLDLGGGGRDEERHGDERDQHASTHPHLRCDGPRRLGETYRAIA